MKLKRYLVSTLGVMALTLSIGCSNTNQKSDVKSSSNKEEVVVATSVAVTEILDSLGVKVVGVPTTTYDLPESTNGAVEVGNPMNPDLEIIKSLNPSIVVSVNTLGKDFKNLFIQNNIPSEFVNLSTIDGLKETIKTLGIKFNKENKSNDLLQSLKDKEIELTNKFSNDDKKKVLVVFGAPGSIMIGTDKSYVGNLVKIAGGENVFGEGVSSYIPVNMEEIIKSNPDTILVMTHALPEETKKMVEVEFNSNPSWKNVSAIKNNNVHYLENSYFGMSANLKVIEALDKLGAILYE